MSKGVAKRRGRWWIRLLAVILTVAIIATFVLYDATKIVVTRIHDDSAAASAIDYLLSNTEYLNLSASQRAIAEIGTLFSDKNFQRYYTEAAVCIGKAQYQEALAVINEYLSFPSEKQSDSSAAIADLWLKKGCLEALTNQSGTALVSLDHALSIDDSLDEARYIQMQLHVERNELPLAIESLKAYMQRVNDPSLYTTLGDLYIADAQYALAEAQYNTVLASDEEKAGRHDQFMRGLCRLQMGEMETAREDFARCAETADTYVPQSWYYLGVIDLQLTHYAQAEYDLSQSIALSQGETDIVERQFLLGVSRMAQGAFETAAQAFTESISLGEAVTDSHYDRGVCYLELGRMADAEADFTACLANDGSNLEAMYYRGMALIGQGDYQAAYLDVFTALDAGFHAKDGQFQLAACCLNTGDYEGAIAAYTRCIETGYEKDQSLFNRALAYYQAEDLKKAIEEFTFLMDDAEYGEQARFYRGLCYTLMGEDEKAAADLNENTEIGKTD